MLAPLVHAASAFSGSNDTRHPIVLMPGLAGSRLQAQLHDSVEPHFWCEKSSGGEWLQLWLSLEQVAPEQKDCLMSRIALTYNSSTGNYSDAQGVTLDTNVDFGSVGGISSLDPSLAKETGYFRTMIASLTALGYEVGKDLHGASYDWRMAPDGHAVGLYPKLEALLESTVARNGKPAHVITHSLGGPTALAFLNTQTPAWLAAHVESFVPISGPFAGAASQIKAYVCGDTLGIPFIPSDYLQPIQVTAASGIFMMPAPGATFAGSTLVRTASKNYTADDWQTFLADLGHTQAAAIGRALDARRLSMKALRAPGVKTHVVTSAGVKTPLEYVFEGSLEPGYRKTPQEVINGDGDGTVNLQSLLLPQTGWADNSGAPLLFFNVSGVEHFSMVSDSRVLGYIKSEVLGL